MLENASVGCSKKKTELIEKAIRLINEDRKTFSLNRFDICEVVARLVEEKYIGSSLEYHSTRMGLDTTKNILASIDEYIYRYYKYNFC